MKLSTGPQIWVKYHLYAFFMVLWGLSALISPINTCIVLGAV